MKESIGHNLQIEIPTKIRSLYEYQWTTKDMGDYVLVQGTIHPAMDNHVFSLNITKVGSAVSVWMTTWSGGEQFMISGGGELMAQSYTIDRENIEETSATSPAPCQVNVAIAIGKV